LWIRAFNDRPTASQKQTNFNLCAEFSLLRPVAASPDVAVLAPYLAGPDFDYTAGQVIMADGGVVYR
jgi:hypothetical protein